MRPVFFFSGIVFKIFFVLFFLTCSNFFHDFIRRKTIKATMLQGVTAVERNRHVNKRTEFDVTLDVAFKCLRIVHETRYESKKIDPQARSTVVEFIITE